MVLPLDWWNGRPMHIRDMIREVHAALGRRHFRYEDLKDQLLERGYVVKPDGTVVAAQDTS